MSVMIKSTSSILAALMLLLSCDTDRNIDPPDETHFVKYYGADLDEGGVDIIVLPDGEALLLGKASIGKHGIYMVRINSKGDIVWEKYFGSSTDVPKDIEPTLDGKYVVLSDYESAPGNMDVKILKIDGTTGVKEDSAVHGSPGIENAKSITALSDGGFILTGSTEYTSAIPKPGDTNDGSDIFHFRCDQNLEFNIPLWEDQYGGGSIDGASKVFEKSLDDFYVFGYSNQDHGEYKSGKANLQYYALASAGGAKVAPNYVGDFAEDTRSSYVSQVPSSMGGGFFIVGTKVTLTNRIRVYAARLKQTLYFDGRDESMKKEIDLGTNAFEAVSAGISEFGGPTGFFVLANEYRLENNINISLSKIDQGGTRLWNVSLGSEDKDDWAAAVSELPDGRILVLGTVTIGDQTKMALFKLNSTGQLIK